MRTRMMLEEYRIIEKALDVFKFEEFSHCSTPLFLCVEVDDDDDDAGRDERSHEKMKIFGKVYL